ncbi:MAG: TRAP transporter small permease [Pseudomonadota bacterium]
MNRLDRLVTAVIKPLVVILSLFVALSMVTGILARSVFGAPMLGLEEFVLLSVMWLYMLGAGLAAQENSHLRADFVHVISDNPKFLSATKLIASVISLFMAVVFVVWSWDLLLWGVTRQQSTAVFQIPLYASQASLFVCSLLFVLFTARDVYNDYSKLTGS